MKYKWKADQTIEFVSVPGEIKFLGRNTVAVPNDVFLQCLMALGTFENLGDGNVRYIGNAYWLDSEGNKVSVDLAGFVEIDWSKFSDEQKQTMLLELEES